jgi:hypothetical protein
MSIDRARVFQFPGGKVDVGCGGQNGLVGFQLKVSSESPGQACGNADNTAKKSLAHKGTPTTMTLVGLNSWLATRIRKCYG